MSDRLNDTDPQSPAAMPSRTDPGIGSPPPIVVARPVAEVEESSPLPPTPVPGSASIEELLDGITGPRPPPSSRREGPEAARVYSAARPAPASHRTPPPQPAVFSPEPPDGTFPARPDRGPHQLVSERDALTVPRAPLDPGSTRPVVRRGEERTVYTGRRALMRNSVAVILSAVAVTAMMMGIMRWKEAHRPPHAALEPIVESPLPPTPEVVPTGPAPTIVIVSPPPAETSTAPVVATSASAAASAPPVVPRRLPWPRHMRAAPAASGSLDDLNREISH
jgi:hypothetical protein